MMNMTSGFVPTAGSGPGHVLVADDEEKNRKLLRDILESQGHVVTLAEDGQQALDLARSVSPHAILLDVMMPERDGFEVCRSLKANPRTAPIPILMVTALTERADRIAGVAAGADDFLSKPIDREELVLRVRNAVMRKQMYDELAERYAELRAMAELRDSLTCLIDADTEALTEQMRQEDARTRTANGVEPTTDGADEASSKGGCHGTH